MLRRLHRLFAAVIGFLCVSSSFAFTAQDAPATIHSWCDPSTVAIGEPFTLHVDIVHSKQQRILLDELPEAGFGLGLVLLEERPILRVPIAGEVGRTLTQGRWRLFAVEAGEHELLSVGADVLRSGVVQRLDSVGAAITVRPEMAEGEDEARPLIAFRAPPELAKNPLRETLLWTGLVLLVLSVRWWGRGVLHLIWILRGRPGAPQDGPQLSALERLRAVDASAEGGERELYYSMSQLLREAIDREAAQREAHAARDLAGLTDAEWVAVRRERNGIAPARLERVAKLLASCERVKYGAELPTRWAIEEALGEAQALAVPSEATESAQAAVPASEIGGAA